MDKQLRRAMIGNDGAVGILSALGPSRSPITAVVNMPGTALQISPARFFSAFNHSTALRHSVQMHTMAMLVQFQHVAACNALHSVEARLAGGCFTYTTALISTTCR